jgi:hypothetical protein
MFRGTLQERIVAPFILADPVIHLHYDKFLYYNIKFIVTRLINKISLLKLIYIDINISK